MSTKHSHSSTSPTTHKWAILAILALSLSMIVLDGTIVSVALPVIIHDLHLNLVDAQWVNALYSVVFAALLIVCGTLGDKYGRRKTIIIGIIIFTSSSLIAALATTTSTLITARALQGIGGAIVMPSTLSTVNAIFRGRDRAVAFAIWGATMAGMAAVGPLVGGWITTSFTWPWIFLINLPLGTGLIVTALIYLPENYHPHQSKGFDGLGALLCTLGFGLTVFGLIEGSRLGWTKPQHALHIGSLTWDITKPISLAPLSIALGLAILSLFLWREYHQEKLNRPHLIKLSLFQIRSFSWGNLVAITVAIGEFAIVFATPLFLVNVINLSTLQSGWVLAAMAFGALFSGGLAKTLATKFGAAQVVILGLILELTGVSLMAITLSPTLSIWAITLFITTYGFGIGIAAAQLTSTILQEVPIANSGMGSATQSTVRQLGSALGAAVAGTVLAVSLTNLLPNALTTVHQLPTKAVQQLTSVTTDSAGGTILALSKITPQTSPYGPATSEIVKILKENFAIATSHNLLVAALFLLIGLLAAWRLWVVSKPSKISKNHSITSAP